MEEYQNLANRNGWSFSMVDNRPYFMKNGDYAIPDETTSQKDKELLAEIISEGSSEMKKTILMCWANHIVISGPCSGITDYHQGKENIMLHFSFAGDKERIENLKRELMIPLPDLGHRISERNGLTRYDITYPTEGLAPEEANGIFEMINEALRKVYKIEDIEPKTY